MRRLRRSPQSRSPSELPPGYPQVTRTHRRQLRSACAVSAPRLWNLCRRTCVLPPAGSVHGAAGSGRAAGSPACGPRAPRRPARPPSEGQQRPPRRPESGDQCRSPPRSGGGGGNVEQFADRAGGTCLLRRSRGPRGPATSAHSLPASSDSKDGGSRCGAVSPAGSGPESWNVSDVLGGFWGVFLGHRRTFGTTR